MFTSVIIPAYNEESRIRATLDGIRDIDIINQIVVVDDGSSDGTAQVLKNYVCDKLVYTVQNPNQGKGKALEKGLELADKSADVIVFLDADLGLTSSEIAKVIEPVLADQCDVSIARFKPASKKGGMGFVKRLARDSVYEMTGVELKRLYQNLTTYQRDMG